MPDMYWYDASTWKKTNTLYVYDAGTWKLVKECYIWDGSWKLCHVTPSSLDSFNVYNIDPSCDSTVGSFEITWTYTSPNPNDYTIYLYYSFDNGANYSLYSSYSTTSGYETSLSLNGFVGFTSLDDTRFRLRMLLNSSGTNATNSPRTKLPPYIC